MHSFHSRFVVRRQVALELVEVVIRRASCQLAALCPKESPSKANEWTARAEMTEAMWRFARD